MAESIILDPVEINPARTQLDITPWISEKGVDWGDSAIEAYMANLDTGSLPSGYRLPNRQINIPLVLQTKDDITYDDIRSKLKRKIGLIQSKKGSLKRVRSTGDRFGDIVNASLHLGGDTLAAFRDVDVNAAIKIETLPDFFGPEVVTDTLSATNLLSSPLQVGGINAVIGGDYPARTRIIVTDTSAQVQKNLFWAFQRDHYDAAATAALFYEAEALTPQNGAAIAASASGSGGSKVNITGTPANVWIPMLVTNLVSGNQPLTHKGTFRMLARCSCATGIPSFRLKWGVGSLATPTLNDSVTMPGDASGSWYLLDLGVIRLEAAPVGVHQWFGIIHAFSPTGNDDIGIDYIALQPLDEGSGRLLSVPPPADDPTSNTSVKAFSGHGINNTGVGSVAWTWPNEIRYADLGHRSEVTVNNSQSNRLRGDTFGLAIPTGATILGVRVRVALSASDWVWGALRLVKQDGTTYTAEKGKWIKPTFFSNIHFGAATDLWGSALVPGDFNGTVFGVQLNVSTDYDGDAWVGVYFYRVTVFYRLGTILGIADDAVVYASRPTEIRTDGAYHTPDGSVYGPVSDVRGQFPRLPQSGLESLPVRLFLKPSRGDPDQWWPDAGLDAFNVQVRFRPCYLG